MKNNEISNLQVFDLMVKEGNTGIALATTLVDSYSTKQGGVIGFGVEKKFSDDASFQREFGFPGTYMLFCFAVDRKEFESTKQKFQEPTEKKFFIRRFYNTQFKNKLDIMLRSAFEVFENKIITETQLNEFPDIHEKATEAYYASGGKCKAISYSSTYTGYFTPTSSRENANVYVTDGYWLEVIEVKEG